MLYSALRRILFCLDAEAAHKISLGALKQLHKTGLTNAWLAPRVSDPIKLMGLHFPNRVGLAAGLDKNGEYIDSLAALGFGHIEIGTVTPKAQSGNPKPRLFRLSRHGAIINRMGFNNFGVDALLDQVKGSQFTNQGGITGINIGKNAATPIEQASADYLACLTAVYTVASYVCINISSPNTKNLRTLQTDDALEQLLHTLKNAQTQLAQQHGRYVPLAVKIAPDLTKNEIQLIADTLRRQRMDAVIATNTTLSRDHVADSPDAQENGGLSGAPLFDRSTTITQQLSEALKKEIPVIGVGGINNGQAACEKLDAGASLVQLYTGLIYRGPQLVHQVAKALANHS